jgi:hypothetical protein
LTKEAKELLEIIYSCPKAGTKVHLKIACESTAGFFGKKYTSQHLKKCDLLTSGGCTVRIEPAINSKCPAVAKAQKCSLK